MRINSVAAATPEADIETMGYGAHRRVRIDHIRLKIDPVIVRDAALRDWKAIVAKNVRKLRHQRTLTQEQLAFASSIDLTYFGGIGTLPSW